MGSRNCALSNHPVFDSLRHDVSFTAPSEKKLVQVLSIPQHGSDRRN